MKGRVKWLEMKNLDAMVEENPILSNISLTLYEGENTNKDISKIIIKHLDMVDKYNLL